MDGSSQQAGDRSVRRGHSRVIVNVLRSKCKKFAIQMTGRARREDRQKKGLYGYLWCWPVAGGRRDCTRVGGVSGWVVFLFFCVLQLFSLPFMRNCECDYYACLQLNWMDDTLLTFDLRSHFAQPVRRPISRFQTNRLKPGPRNFLFRIK